jgi:hypothetical protein
MTKAYRHGDIALEVVSEIPKEAIKINTKVLLQSGSGGNPHSFDKGTFYKLEDGMTIGYLKAKGTSLLHKEHGEKQVGGLKSAKIPDGIYRIVKQVEHTHEGMRQVID